MRETLEIECDIELAKELEPLFAQFDITNETGQPVNASGHLTQAAKTAVYLVSGTAKKLAGMILSLFANKKVTSLNMQFGKELEEKTVITSTSSSEQIEHIISTKTGVWLNVKFTKEK